MGDQGEDTAQYSIRPPDSAKFRAGAVKVRMQDALKCFTSVLDRAAAPTVPDDCLLGARFKFSDSSVAATNNITEDCPALICALIFSGTFSAATFPQMLPSKARG